MLLPLTSRCCVRRCMLQEHYLLMPLQGLHSSLILLNSNLLLLLLTLMLLLLQLLLSLLLFLLLVLPSGSSVSACLLPATASGRIRALLCLAGPSLCPASSAAAAPWLCCCKLFATQTGSTCSCSRSSRAGCALASCLLLVVVVLVVLVLLKLAVAGY
jgi:hypothetical protein